MQNIIQKIESTVPIVVEVLVLILSALHLTSVITVVQTWEPIILAILSAVGIIAKIWGVQIRKHA